MNAEIAICDECGGQIPFVNVGENPPEGAQIAVEWWSVDWEEMITEVRCNVCEIGVWV